MELLHWKAARQLLPYPMADSDALASIPDSHAFIVVEGDLKQDFINLDRSAYPAFPEARGLLVTGRLHTRCLYNGNAGSEGLDVVVVGDVATECIATTRQTLVFFGEVVCDGLFWGDMQGQLCALNHFECDVLMATNGYDVDSHWEKMYFDTPLVDGHDPFGDPHLELVEDRFIPEVINRNHGNVHGWSKFLNRPAVIATQLDGRRSLKPSW